MSKPRYRKSEEERRWEKQKGAELKRTEWETLIVNNAPGLYFLNLSSPTGGYPIQGHRLTRKALRSLLCQIRAVLDGNYVCAGKVLSGPVKKPTIVRRWSRRSKRQNW